MQAKIIEVDERTAQCQWEINYQLIQLHQEANVLAHKLDRLIIRSAQKRKKLYGVLPGYVSC